MNDLITQKEKELASLKEKKQKQRIKDEQKTEIYQRTKKEVADLDKELNSKIISPCPFCGAIGNSSSSYYSNDSMPDGHYHYVECNDCSAQGESFYAVATSEMNLTQEEYIIQEKHRLEAMINAIKAWNRRV